MATCEHLLIDGYNIIHAWPDLHGLIATHRETAVDRLCAGVRVIHDLEGVRTTVVLDGSGDEISIERPSGDLTFSCLYTPREVTADCMIEQLVCKARDPNSVCVASNDAMIRESAGASGAVVLSSDGLRDWVVSCNKRQREEIRRRSARQEKIWRATRELPDESTENS